MTSSQPLTTSPHPPNRVLVDLTHQLIPGAIPTCAGHPAYSASLASSIASGDISNVHTLTIGTHTGTHIDAPYHFFPAGLTIDQLDLSLLNAVPAIIADVRTKQAREVITWSDLEERYAGRMKEGVMMLFCTGWSRNWNRENYSEHPFLDPDAAKKIFERGVRVIGVEAMSPDEISEEKGDCGEVHRVVLGQGGIIIENLCNLEKILESGMPEEEVLVSALPLNLVQCDGSPVRAVAWFGGSIRE